VTKSAAIEILLDIWVKLSPASIAAGWAIDEGDFGPNQELRMLRGQSKLGWSHLIRI
jgi:hypothetical protein